jgi:hypothetical protein
VRNIPLVSELSFDFCSSKERKGDSLNNVLFATCRLVFVERGEMFTAIARFCSLTCFCSDRISPFLPF